MSKLGKKPINIPKDTKVKVESGKLILTGPKGSKELSINDKIFSASVSENNNLILKLIKKNDSNKMIWGTTRSIIESAVIGVTSGHEKILELSGVGFRAMLKGNVLNLGAASSSGLVDAAWTTKVRKTAAPHRLTPISATQSISFLPDHE